MNKNIDHDDPAKDMNTTRGNGGETHQRASDGSKVLTTLSLSLITKTL